MRLPTADFIRTSLPAVKHYGKNIALAAAGLATFTVAAIGFATAARICFFAAGEAVYQGGDWVVNKANCAMGRPNCRR